MSLCGFMQPDGNKIFKLKFTKAQRNCRQVNIAFALAQQRSLFSFQCICCKGGYMNDGSHSTATTTLFHWTDHPMVNVILR